MDILVSARKHGIADEEILHAVAHALTVDEVDEDPIRYLILGPDSGGNLLEIVVLDRPNGPCVHPCHENARQVQSSITKARRLTMTKRNNSIEEMANQAEEGYDVDEILRRRGGRPAMGSAPSSVESVRLSPELKRDLLERAAQQGVSLSEAIRTALQEYVRAS